MVSCLICWRYPEIWMNECAHFIQGQRIQVFLPRDLVSTWREQNMTENDCRSLPILFNNNSHNLCSRIKCFLHKLANLHFRDPNFFFWICKELIVAHKGVQVSRNLLTPCTPSFKQVVVQASPPLTWKLLNKLWKRLEIYRFCFWCWIYGR